MAKAKRMDRRFVTGDTGVRERGSGVKRIRGDTICQQRRATRVGGEEEEEEE